MSGDAPVEVTTVLRWRGVTKQCPFKEELDVGELVIVIPGEAPELHALAAKVKEIGARAPISHENFTGTVYDQCDLPGGSLVATRWQTGPWAATIWAGDFNLLRYVGKPT